MTILNYIQSGGTIMYVLLAMNFIGFALILWKFFSFRSERKYIEESAEEIIKSVTQNITSKVEDSFLLEMAKDKVYALTQGMEKGLNTIKIIATISPLLGLLGTVLGVLSSFQSMASSGMKDPSLFASGISMALITTVGGLVVAIPHFISYNYLSGWLTSYEVNLEDKVMDQYLGQNPKEA